MHEGIRKKSRAYHVRAFAHSAALTQSKRARPMLSTTGGAKILCYDQVDFVKIICRVRILGAQHTSTRQHSQAGIAPTPQSSLHSDVNAFAPH